MSKIPLFPLKLVLLPYENLPLHIFEPRYKDMVRNAIEKDIPFGIILREGKGIFSKGCTVKVTKVFKKYQNGEYDIMVKGLERFDVINTEMDGDTVIGQVKYLPLQTESEPDLLVQLQDSYLKVLLRFEIDSDLETHLKKKISYEFLQGLQLPISLKKNLIDIDSETERIRFINDIFQSILKQPFKSGNGNLPEA